MQSQLSLSQQEICGCDVIVFILVQRTETKQSPGQSGNSAQQQLIKKCLKKNCHLFLHMTPTVSNGA
jgi:hypothetical protein